MRKPHNQSISVKLFKTVFLIYFSLTFLITGIHVVVEFLHTKATVLEELRKVEDTFTPLLREVLWRFDERNLGVIAESIHKLPIVVGVTIVNSKGDVLVELSQVVGKQKETELLSHHFSVSHEFGDRQLFLGEVGFYTDSSVIFDRVKIGFLMILLNAAIKSVVLITLSFWAFKRILTKPFESFLEKLLDVDLNDIGKQRLKLNVADGYELQQLEKRFNSMLDKLSQQKEYILESERYQQQQLEKKVEKRTEAIATANELLKNETHEKEHAKQNLLESEERFREIVHNLEKIGLGLLIIDSDYRMTFMNKVLIDSFGNQTGEFCYKVFAQSDTPCSYCKIDEVISEHKVVHYQPTLPGEKTYDIVATPIINSDKSVSKMEIIRDISSQVEQERLTLADTRKEEQLRNLESLRTMAGAIAHRFNNSIMAVQGNLELLKLTCCKDSDEYKMAESAAKAVNGAAQVGSMMLSYVGQNSIQRQTHSLSAVVRDSVAELKEHFHELITLRFRPPDQDLYCSIDQSHIKEVVESILINAIESLGSNKGSIEITFGAAEYKVSSFPIPFQGDNMVDGSYTYCQIKDSGHGISAKNLSRIFEPFYTTRFVGRGLGLAVAVGVMQSHQGAVTVESSLGKGTTVRVLFPTIQS